MAWQMRGARARFGRLACGLVAGPPEERPVLVLVRESIGTRDANGIGTKARQGVYGSLEEELGTGIQRGGGALDPYVITVARTGVLAVIG